MDGHLHHHHHHDDNHRLDKIKKRQKETIIEQDNKKRSQRTKDGDPQNKIGWEGNNNQKNNLLTLVAVMSVCLLSLMDMCLPKK